MLGAARIIRCLPPAGAGGAEYNFGEQASQPQLIACAHYEGVNNKKTCHTPHRSIVAEFVRIQTLLTHDVRSLTSSATTETDASNEKEPACRWQAGSVFMSTVATIRLAAEPLQPWSL